MPLLHRASARATLIGTRTTSVHGAAPARYKLELTHHPGARDRVRRKGAPGTDSSTVLAGCLLITPEMENDIILFACRSDTAGWRARLRLDFDRNAYDTRLVERQHIAARAKTAVSRRRSGLPRGHRVSAAPWAAMRWTSISALAPAHRRCSRHPVSASGTAPTAVCRARMCASRSVRCASGCPGEPCAITPHRSRWPRGIARRRRSLYRQLRSALRAHRSGRGFHGGEHA